MTSFCVIILPHDKAPNCIRGQADYEKWLMHCDNFDQFKSFMEDTLIPDLEGKMEGEDQLHFIVNISWAIKSKYDGYEKKLDEWVEKFIKDYFLRTL